MTVKIAQPAQFALQEADIRVHAMKVFTAQERAK